MDLSVWPNPGRTPDEVFELARLVDTRPDAGFAWHGFWYADHYMPNTGDESFTPGDVHECWAVLPAVAALTEHVRIGPLVAPTSVHHPALLANRAATIDRISDGRFVLGLGAGWQINEHRAYGIELEAPKPRVDRFDEGIQVVRSLLDQDRTTFHGEFYDITDAPCDPKPVQSPLPILVGTGGPRMLRITARHAQEWNTWGGPDVAIEMRGKFHAACESVGADPATKRTTAQALVILTDDQGTVDQAMSGPMADRTIAGSDDQLVEQLARYAEAGFDEFIVPDFALGRTHEERLDNYRRIAENVAPHLP